LTTNRILDIQTDVRDSDAGPDNNDQTAPETFGLNNGEFTKVSTIYRQCKALATEYTLDGVWDLFSRIVQRLIKNFLTPRAAVLKELETKLTGQMAVLEDPEFTNYTDCEEAQASAVEKLQEQARDVVTRDIKEEQAKTAVLAKLKEQLDLTALCTRHSRRPRGACDSDSSCGAVACVDLRYDHRECG
jgi:hypothetical protein